MSNFFNSTFKNYKIYCKLLNNNMYVEIRNTDNDMLYCYSMDSSSKTCFTLVDANSTFKLLYNCFNDITDEKAAECGLKLTIDINHNILIMNFGKDGMNFTLHLKSRFENMNSLYSKCDKLREMIDKTLENAYIALEDDSGETCMDNLISANATDATISGYVTIYDLEKREMYKSYVVYNNIKYLHNLKSLKINCFNHNNFKIANLEHSTLQELTIDCDNCHCFHSIDGIDKLPELTTLTIINSKNLNNIVRTLNSNEHKIKKLTLINTIQNYSDLCDIAKYCKLNEIDFSREL